MLSYGLLKMYHGTFQMYTKVELFNALSALMMANTQTSQSWFINALFSLSHWVIIKQIQDMISSQNTSVSFFKRQRVVFFKHHHNIIITPKNVTSFT